MTTEAATGETLTQGTMQGEVTDDGGTSVTVWFQYGLTTEYGNTSDTSVGHGTGDTFYFTLTDLLCSTVYHYRAVGQNTAGITYGTDENLTTTAPATPTVSTLAASSIGATSATLQGKVDYDGGVDCEVRFDWGTTTAYGSSTGLQPGYTSGVPFSAYIDGLTTGETYHFRAFAVNSTDNDTGIDMEFTTVFTEPTGFQAKTLSGSSIGVTWTKVGDQTAVYMKKGSYPIDRLDGSQVYFGTSSGFTASGLSYGATYFFRAWSWKIGGTWSDGYSEDAATTGSEVGTTGEPTSPGDDIVGPIPEDPGNWWLEPTGDGLIEFPFHTTIEDAATSLGIPSGGMWALIGVLIVCIFGLFAGILVKGNLFVLGGTLVLAMGFSSTLGLLPLWVAILSLLAFLGYYWSTSKG
jgi:hypothetical protein